MADNNNERIDELIKDKPDPAAYEAHQRLNDSWKAFLSTRGGRVVLRDLLSLCEFGRSAFGGDTETTLMKAGKQVVGEYIVDKLGECYPEAYALMLKETKEDEQYDRDSSRNTSDSTESIRTSSSGS